MTKPPRNRRNVLSREKWLAMAIDVLAHKRTSKFNLDSLLKEMPVTKGSFYNHFKNRRDFLIALVEYWDRHDTKTVVDQMESLPADMTPEDKLWEMMCVIYEMRLNEHDLLFRSLTLEAPEILDAVKAVDKRRLKSVGGLFAEMGFEGDELTMRTLAFTTVTSQENHILSDISKEAFERQLKLRHAFFIRP